MRVRNMPFVISAFLVLAIVPGAHATPSWTSPNHYRVLLSVDPRAVPRDNSPAQVDIDFHAALASAGSGGTFDEDTIEVVAYDASGAPCVFDSTRSGYEKRLLPWRVQNYYGIDSCMLSFVMPSHAYTQYAVYFDTVASGLGQPERYPGLVGDGDWFKEVYARREINGSHFDSFADFDGDGDLDLFKCGVEPFIYCYENVGANRYVDRGLMTSGGSVFELPASVGSNRSWAAIEFYDWDEDGDMDLFVSFADGPDTGHIVRWQNMTVETGQLTFVSRGRLLTQSGKPMSSGWFGMITIVDWDGDGKKDILATREDLLEFHKNIGPDDDIQNIVLADGIYITANGNNISFRACRVDCADIDTDGDLDLFSVAQGGSVYMFENVGTRTDPVFRAGRMVAYSRGGHTGVKVSDFDGDGLLDFVYGRTWEISERGEFPRCYGRLYKNVGTPTGPRFQARDAYGGSPYTERFQICEAVRQNSVRAYDWNNDGKKDLIAARGDGWVWHFINTTNHLFPVFAVGEPLLSDGEPMQVNSRQGGYARADIPDWNGDGKKDLLLADGGGLLWLYLNEGTDANPVLGPKTAVEANGTPLDRAWRGSVLWCDWDNDGLHDVVYADELGYYFYENTGTPTSPDLTAGTNVEFNGQTVSYTRPNLGSYVDWDADGKRDFIGCEFENNIRFYKNIGSGGVGDLPEFANREGVTIVQPYTVQMVSGADAVDWNGDGDIDILTGQGHGGSGLRFYERDYIDDYVNSERFPIVSVGTSEPALTVAEVKSLADGTSVTVVQGIVTACFDDFFYIESADRVSGIRVELPSYGCSIGDVVDVRGVLGTNAAGERYIQATSVTINN